MVNKNIKIVRGDSYAFSLTFKQNNEVVNITDYTIMFTLKKNARDIDDDALISKVLNIVDGASGTARLELSHADTNINSGIYVYDIQIVTNNNGVHTPIIGTLTVTSDITQAVG